MKGFGKNFLCRTSFLHSFFIGFVYDSIRWESLCLTQCHFMEVLNVEMDVPYHLPLLLDGATGTNLIHREHMPLEQCPEQWILQHPQALLSLQHDFVKAGSQVLLAPTFQANALALEKYGLAAEDINLTERLVFLTKQASGGNTLVAGSIGPTGQGIEPFGKLRFQQIVDTYRRQVQAMRKAGVDLIVCETMTSLSDARAALLAAKETGLPVFVSVVVTEEEEEMPDGTKLLCALAVLQSMGADAFGINCSGSPGQILPWFEKIAPYAQIPLLAKPNPGNPNPVNLGQYDLGPEIFAKEVGRLIDVGVSIVGGCCGTSPEHVHALANLIRNRSSRPLQHHPDENEVLAASGHEAFFLREDMTMGEPLSCELDMADDILEYEDSGFDILPVQVETEDDAYHLGLNCHMFRLPVLIASHSFELMEQSLFEFQGRALVDSQCGLENDELYRLAKRYGAIVY